MTGSPPTRRVNDTLEHLAAAETPRTIAQIADALGVARPTMSAILSELDAAGWVQRDAARAYRLGPAAIALGHDASPTASTIGPDALAVLDELVAATACGVTVSRFADTRMTVVAKVHSQTRPVPGLGLGQSLTASYPAGAAVMAWRPHDEQRIWLGEHGRRSMRAQSVLAGVREHGYAAYRPTSSDASLVESLADLLGAVGSMLIDPAVRRSATRQLAELSSRAYQPDEFSVAEPIPVSYLAAPVRTRTGIDCELQLGVLRSAVKLDERRALAAATIEAADRIAALFDATQTADSR